MNYALLDKSQTIRAVHLRAALALWKYCVDSARYLFLRRLAGIQHAKKIYAVLRCNPTGTTRTETVVYNIFKRNVPKDKLDEALSYLRRIDFGSLLHRHQPRAGRSNAGLPTPEKSNTKNITRWRGSEIS